MKITWKQQKQLLCIRLAGVKLTKPIQFPGQQNSKFQNIKIRDLFELHYFLPREISHPVWHLFAFVSPMTLSQLKAVGVNLCPQGKEYTRNYYPDHATWLAHLLLQVCCLIWLSDGVSSLFVLFPHYFLTLPGKVRLELPVKLSHPHPSTQLCHSLNWGCRFGELHKNFP